MAETKPFPLIEGGTARSYNELYLFADAVRELAGDPAKRDEIRALPGGAELVDRINSSSVGISVFIDIIANFPSHFGFDRVVPRDELERYFKYGKQISSGTIIPTQEDINAARNEYESMKAKGKETAENDFNGAVEKHNEAKKDVRKTRGSRFGNFGLVLLSAVTAIACPVVGLGLPIMAFTSGLATSLMAGTGLVSIIASAVILGKALPAALKFFGDRVKAWREAVKHNREALKARKAARKLRKTAEKTLDSATQKINSDNLYNTRSPYPGTLTPPDLVSVHGFEHASEREAGRTLEDAIPVSGLSSESASAHTSAYVAVRTPEEESRREAFFGSKGVSAEDLHAFDEFESVKTGDSYSILTEEQKFRKFFGEEKGKTAEEIDELETRYSTFKSANAEFIGAMPVSETAAESVATAEPEAPVEPEVTAEPEAPAEPEVTAEPEAPVEPEVTAEPEEPVEPEATTEPEAPVEPEATAEPEETVEPEATAESEVTAEPEAPVEPVEPVATEDVRVMNDMSSKRGPQKAWLAIQCFDAISKDISESEREKVEAKILEKTGFSNVEDAKKAYAKKRKINVDEISLDPEEGKKPNRPWLAKSVSEIVGKENVDRETMKRRTGYDDPEKAVVDYSKQRFVKATKSTLKISGRNGWKEFSAKSEKDVSEMFAKLEENQKSNILSELKKLSPEQRAEALKDMPEGLKKIVSKEMEDVLGEEKEVSPETDKTNAFKKFENKMKASGKGDKHFTDSEIRKEFETFAKETGMVAGGSEVELNEQVTKAWREYQEHKVGELAEKNKADSVENITYAEDGTAKLSDDVKVDTDEIVKACGDKLDKETYLEKAQEQGLSATEAEIHFETSDAKGKLEEAQEEQKVETNPDVNAENDEEKARAEAEEKARAEAEKAKAEAEEKARAEAEKAKAEAEEKAKAEAEKAKAKAEEEARARAKAEAEIQAQMEKIGNELVEKLLVEDVKYNEEEFLKIAGEAGLDSNTAKTLYNKVYLNRISAKEFSLTAEESSFIETHKNDDSRDFYAEAEKAGIEHGRTGIVFDKLKKQLQTPEEETKQPSEDEQKVVNNLVEGFKKAPEKYKGWKVEDIVKAIEGNEKYKDLDAETRQYIAQKAFEELVKMLAEAKKSGAKEKADDNDQPGNE